MSPSSTTPLSPERLEQIRAMRFVTGLNAAVGHFATDEERALYRLAAEHYNARLELLGEIDRLRARVAEQGPICTEAEAHAAGLDIVPTPTELEAMASSVIDAAGGSEQVAADLGRAVLLLLTDRARLQQQLGGAA